MSHEPLTINSRLIYKLILHEAIHVFQDLLPLHTKILKIYQKCQGRIPSLQVPTGCFALANLEHAQMSAIVHLRDDSYFQNC